MLVVIEERLLVSGCMEFSVFNRTWSSDFIFVVYLERVSKLDRKQKT